MLLLLLLLIVRQRWLRVVSSLCGEGRGEGRGVLVLLGSSKMACAKPWMDYYYWRSFAPTCLLVVEVVLPRQQHHLGCCYKLCWACCSRWCLAPRFLFVFILDSFRRATWCPPETRRRWQIASRPCWKIRPFGRA